MQLINYLKLLYGNLSYQKKLLWSYFSLVLMPLLVLSVFFYTRTTEILRSNFLTLSSVYLEQAGNSLDTRFSEMISLGKSFSLQPALRAALGKDPDGLSLATQGSDLKTMELSISNVYYDFSLYNVRLFVNQDFSYSDRRILTWPLSDAYTMAPGREDLLLKQPLLTGPNICQSTMSAPQTVFSLTKPIYGLSDYTRTVALACVDIHRDKVIEIMKSADFSQNGTVYLTDASHRLLLCYSNTEQKLLTGNSLPELPQEGGQLQHGDTLVTVSPLILGSYYLVAEASIRQYTWPNELLPLQFFCLALFIGFLIYLLATFYARTNSRRILMLNNSFKKLQQGDLTAHCIIDSEDEIGELQLSFNETVQRMQKMMDDQYHLGQRLKDNEFQILQEQINPHFLYNTLDLVMWAARNRESDEVCDIISKLSRYYRISLSKGKETILLSEELEHISLYVALQNKRFENKIRLEISVEAGLDTGRLAVLKLLLQPIVENSIVHGFLDRSRPLLLTVSVAKKDENLSIVIMDNGCGISPRQLARFRFYQELRLPARPAPEDTADSPEGYGAVNVASRIRSFYGPQASFRFESAPGQGTSVLISLPYEKCETLLC